MKPSISVGLALVQPANVVRLAAAVPSHATVHYPAAVPLPATVPSSAAVSSPSAVHAPAAVPSSAAVHSAGGSKPVEIEFPLPRIDFTMTECGINYKVVLTGITNTGADKYKWRRL